MVRDRLIVLEREPYRSTDRSRLPEFAAIAKRRRAQITDLTACSGHAAARPKPIPIAIGNATKPKSDPNRPPGTPIPTLRLYQSPSFHQAFSIRSSHKLQHEFCLPAL